MDDGGREGGGGTEGRRQYCFIQLFLTLLPPPSLIEFQTRT